MKMATNMGTPAPELLKRWVIRYNNSIAEAVDGPVMRKWARVHQTLRMTPAMEAGWTDHIWTIKELLTQEA